jgi:hypothetical protein
MAVHDRRAAAVTSPRSASAGIWTIEVLSSGNW